MTKSDIIIELKTQKIVVVVRGKTKEEGLKASIACIKGGIKAIEVAYTNQYASEIIKELNHLYQDDASHHGGKYRAFLLAKRAHHPDVLGLHERFARDRIRLREHQKRQDRYDASRRR